MLNRCLPVIDPYLGTGQKCVSFIFQSYLFFSHWVHQLNVSLWFLYIYGFKYYLETDVRFHAINFFEDVYIISSYITSYINLLYTELFLNIKKEICQFI